jgi:RES domain-containing protein
VRTHLGFEGEVYRVTGPTYTIADTLTASRGYPGRFNTSTVGALYVSLDKNTALAELIRRAQLANLSPTAYHPRALFTYIVRLQAVLDLTDTPTCDAWGLTHPLLLSDDHTACQEVAAAAHRDGYEAIRYPSVTGHGDNLAIYYDARHAGSHVLEIRSDLIDLDRLPSLG